MYGTVTLHLQGKTGTHWRSIIDEDLENPNGAIFFSKRVDGGDLRDPDLLGGQKQLERQAMIISHVFNSMSVLEEQLANISNLKNLDLETMASKLQIIADKVKNVKILTRGGGASNEVAAIGAELG